MKERDLYLLGGAALLAGGLWYIYGEEGGGADLPLIGPVIGPLVGTAKENRLEPSTKVMWFALKQALLDKHDIEALAATTLRTEAEQAKALKSGASDAEFSWHMSGRAIDAWLRRPGEVWDQNVHHPDLYRTMHQEWAALGGHGIGYKPYPNGPKALLRSGKWDIGHLENPGPYTSAEAAYLDYIA